MITKFYSLLLIMVILCSIIGCKTTIQTEVKSSVLRDNNIKSISGDMFIEIPSCSDFSDPTKPSDGLLKSQQVIPDIFKDATFCECFSQDFDTYAHYKIPIYIDRSVDGKLASAEHINIISNEAMVLGLGVPKCIKDKLQRHNEDATLLDLNIKFVHDGQDKIVANIYSSYVNNLPIIRNECTLSPGSYFIKLSNVSVDYAIENQLCKIIGPHKNS
jgi:hypothetical protein